MTPEEYTDEHEVTLEGKRYLSEDDACEAVDIAKRELAEYIRNMILNYRKQNTNGGYSWLYSIFL